MSRLRLIAPIAILACVMGAHDASATPINIGFDTLVAGNGTPFAGVTEQGYTVTPTAGSWFVAQAFGNPVPDLFAGPIGSPSTSAVDVTGPLFTPLGAQLSCNNGTTDCLVMFQGFLNGVLLWTDSPSLDPISTFVNFNNPDLSRVVDTLRITIAPGLGTTSMNIDNIRVNPVPEPGTLALLGSGLLLAGRRFRRTRRS